MFPRRSARVAGLVALGLAASGVPGGAASSPYPATLAMTAGLAFSSIGHPLPWGRTLSEAEAKWVTLASSGPTYRWGVWKRGGGPSEYPVRMVNGGAWTAAGPQLASDWAGGGLYYVSRVLPESPSAVVMVSNSVIDVTTDAGHRWYQYLNPADNWSITAHSVGGAIGIRVGPASYAQLPKGSFAIYTLHVARHAWQRTSESLG